MLDGEQCLLILQASNLAAAEEALVMFRYKVRRALRDQQGYECQEADGDFMLAFTSPCDAARFCLSVGLCCLLLMAAPAFQLAHQDIIHRTA